MTDIKKAYDEDTEDKQVDIHLDGLDVELGSDPDRARLEKKL